jgi:hypothetical protein
VKVAAAPTEAAKLVARSRANVLFWTNRRAQDFGWAAAEGGGGGGGGGGGSGSGAGSVRPAPAPGESRRLSFSAMTDGAAGTAAAAAAAAVSGGAEVVGAQWGAAAEAMEGRLKAEVEAVERRLTAHYARELAGCARQLEELRDFCHAEVASCTAAIMEASRPR